jgi:hypothetical protein
MAGATFRGMNPWRPDGGIIDCEDTELGHVDLHNECDFLELSVTPARNAELLVHLLFRHLPTGRGVTLSFGGVSDLEVAQLDHVPEDAHLLHDISHVPDDTLSVVEVELASMRLGFRTSRVDFTAP